MYQCRRGGSGLGSMAVPDGKGGVEITGATQEPDWSTMTTLNRDIYTVFSPTGHIAAGDIVPTAWLPGMNPAPRPAAPSKMPLIVGALAVGVLALFFMKGR